MRSLLIAFLLGSALESHSLAQGEASAAGSSRQPSSKDASPPSRDDESLEAVVTATRTPRPLRDVPATVTVLPRQEIAQSPTQTLDELLRALPSFATFRRTNSVTSDPTAQGVNLRGIGPSGVSRSLVLIDGLPANDAFGGWFYWRQIPRIGIERIEVVPGGGSALYGNYALGGVIQVFSRPVIGREIDVDALAGYREQLSLAARAADRLGPATAILQGEGFSTSGYPVIATAARGPVDQDASSDHANVAASFALEADHNLQLWARGGYFWERQNSGTPLSGASVRSGSYSVGTTLSPSRLGRIDLAFFGHVQDFKQDRSRINASRSSEMPAARQDVPTDDQGLTALWSSHPLSWGGTHQLTSGVELRRIHGVSREDLYPALLSPSAIVRREAGGDQEFLGLFAQDSYQIFPALELVGALRLDGWRNLRARAVTQDQSGNGTTTPFANRTDLQLSPKLAARYRVFEWLTLRASAYTGFRAPTLNELYRPFQVGTILTAANDQLSAETLRGAEAGVELNPFAGLNLRLTGFWSVLYQPITNLTLPAPLPDGSQRQRENLGQARIRGLEMDAGWHFARAWTASVAYTFVDPTVTQAPGVPQLVGNRLAQDPLHRGSLSLTFNQPKLLIATVQARFVGPQFEDDLNQLRMPEFLIIDLGASRRLFSSLEVYAAIENLLNRQYLVSRAGIDMIGQPFTVRVGLRLHLGG